MTEEKSKAQDDYELNEDDRKLRDKYMPGKYWPCLTILMKMKARAEKDKAEPV